MPRLRVAAIQMNASTDKQQNWAKAEELIAQAVVGGARVVCLPEMFSFTGRGRENVDNAESLDGPTVGKLKVWAKSNGIYLVGGSFFERIENSSKVHNTSVVVDPTGQVLAKYRKIHLFDVELKSFTFRESDVIQPGESDCIFETEYGGMGLTICFDLRFPELYRQEALKGVRVIFVPSAFTMFTGKDHWQPLIQARAIENQVFIVAANQIGASASGLTFYGRSLIVDPWGIPLACAEDKETAIIADLDFDRQAEIRAELPTLPRVRIKIATS